jgi:hypothetical protein
MCKLDGTKCDTCYEVVVHTDSGMDLEFTYDARDKDNDIIKPWLFATDYVDSISIRQVGGVIWSVMTKEDWQNGQA